MYAEKQKGDILEIPDFIEYSSPCNVPYDKSKKYLPPSMKKTLNIIRKELRLIFWRLVDEEKKKRKINKKNKEDKNSDIDENETNTIISSSSSFSSFTSSSSYSTLSFSLLDFCNTLKSLPSLSLILSTYCTTTQEIFQLSYKIIGNLGCVNDIIYRNRMLKKSFSNFILNLIVLEVNDDDDDGDNNNNNNSNNNFDERLLNIKGKSNIFKILSETFLNKNYPDFMYLNEFSEKEKKWDALSNPYFLLKNFNKLMFSEEVCVYMYVCIFCFFFKIIYLFNLCIYLIIY
jgi:hypothetical protein